MSKLIPVNGKALADVLNALNGQDHFIRELQATRSLDGLLGGDPNPINVLEQNFKAFSRDHGLTRVPHVANPRLWCVVGADNIHHIFDNGIPKTQRRYEGSEERVKRMYWKTRELAWGYARELQNGRWSNKTVALVTFDSKDCVVDEDPSRAALCTLLRDDVPRSLIDPVVEFVRPIP